MKEKLYTIPLMDAFRANDECPFCYIERNLEQHALDFVLGPECTHMQGDVRAATDKLGFCKEHYLKMFHYGNRLGSAQILETHMKALLSELKGEMKDYTVITKPNIVERLRKKGDAAYSSNNVSKWVHEKSDSCYICDHMKNNYERYMATFFVLFKKGEPEFIELVENGKGFCLPHFADILDRAPLYLSEKDQKHLREVLFLQMEKNLNRVLEDVEWFQRKNDYRYQKEDWKNSRDAVQRAMQKIGSGYPADAPYKPQ